MLVAFWGSLAIGAIVAWLAEVWGFTRHGRLQAVVIALGGVVLVYLARVMFHLSLGAPGWDAIAGAVGALALIPSEAVRRRRRRK